jgi:hypothetical protein
MQLPMQPKYGFAAQLGEETLSFAPFDRMETAEQIKAGMESQGVDCGEVMLVHTATTARQILAALRRGWKPQRRMVVEEQLSEPIRVEAPERLELDPPRRGLALAKLRKLVNGR